MATVQTPVRIAKIMRTSVQDAAEETTLDFELASDQGVRILVVRFDINELVLVPGAAQVTETAFMSLHIEEGALEAALDAPADRQRLNSEIIAENAIEFIGSNTAGEGLLKTPAWLGDPVHDFNAMGGFDIALNPQFRVVTSAAVLTMNGCQATLFYQYIRFTRSELATQFLLRR